MYIAHVGDFEQRVVRRGLKARVHYHGVDVFEWLIEESLSKPSYLGSVLFTSSSAHAKDDPDWLSSWEGVTDDVLLGVARLQVLRKGREAHSRALHAYDWEEVAGVPVRAAVDLLPPDEARSAIRTLRSADGSVAELSGEVERHFLRALDHVAPGVTQLLNSKASPPQGADLLDYGRAEARDKAMTALRISRAALAGPPQPEDVPGNIPRELQRLERVIEPDAVDHDSDVFPGWTRAQSRLGWHEFQHGGKERSRRLLIKNIDAKPQEKVTGGDLLYIRRDPDLLVAVQYKRLERGTGRGSDWLFTDDGRLFKQLDRLLRLDNIAPPSLLFNPAQDFRLFGQSGYVKFVDTYPLGVDTASVLEGCYLPAEYAKALLAPEWERRARKKDGDRQEKPFKFNPRRQRYLDSQTFVRLVSDGWIGSTSAIVRALEGELAVPVSMRSGGTLIAYDEPRSQS